MLPSWTGSVAQFLDQPPRLGPGSWLYMFIADGDPLYVGMTHKDPVHRISAHVPRTHRAGGVTKSAVRALADSDPESAMRWTIQITNVCGDLRAAEAHTIWELKPRLNQVNNPDNGGLPYNPHSTWASEIIKRLREFGIHKTQVGEIIGADPRQVQRWAHCQAEPRLEHRERLIELDQLARAIVEIHGPDRGMSWFLHPSPHLPKGVSPYRWVRGGRRRISRARQALENDALIISERSSIG